MHDLEMGSFQDFRHKHLSALEALLSDMDSGTWGERLRDWLNACALSPHAALQKAVLETVVIDLVTFELACQAYALEEEGLRVSDRGGTVCARRTLGDLLLLIGEWDPKMARTLASLARASRNERLGRIRSLVVART